MNRRSTILLAVLGSLLFLAAGGVLLWRYAIRTVRRELLAPQEKTIDVASLVTQVRELSRLETASMRVVSVSTITQSYKMVPNALSGDELTFLAAGDVIAGIDLSQLQPDDVWREPDGTIVMRMPSPQILVSRVDNRESRVMSRKTGVLRRSDPGLESRARQSAEQEIRNKAVREGILPLAQANAEKQLAGFMHKLGAEIRVGWRYRGRSC